jgi:hypothetical protein
MKEGAAPEYTKDSSTGRRSLDGWVRALAAIEGLDHRRHRKPVEMASNDSLY